MGLLAPGWKWPVWTFHSSITFEIYFGWSLTASHPHLLMKSKSVALQAWSGQEGSRKLRFPDFMTTAQDGGKVVSLTHRLSLPPGNAPGTHFCKRLSRSQDHSAIGRILCQWKIPMIPAGIEPVTFWFVAQHFNHCAIAVPHTLTLWRRNYFL